MTNEWISYRASPSALERAAAARKRARAGRVKARQERLQTLAETHTRQECADILGVSQATIAGDEEALGITCRPTHQRRGKHPSAKAEDAKALAAQKLSRGWAPPPPPPDEDD